MAKKRRTPSTDGKQHNPWERNTDLIRRFLDLHPQYEQLASEVAYTLKRQLVTSNIEVSAVTWRAKTLNSFLEKLERKKYSDPLNDISDFAGVRIVHLYVSDFQRIEKVISKEFRVTEKVDKLADQGDDKFGYVATHFIVQLGSGSSGARYDDLKSLRCEIQVRTALQDAWAIISHHLMYKRESDIPVQLRRKINSLAGLLETADDQFERIRTEREEYVRQIEVASQNVPAFAEEPINADTVRVFLQERFSSLPVGVSEKHLAYVLEGLDHRKYKTIGDLSDVLGRTQKAVAAYDRESGPCVAAAGVLAVALAFDDPKYRRDGWDDDSRSLFSQFEGLVAKK